MLRQIDKAFDLTTMSYMFLFLSSWAYSLVLLPCIVTRKKVVQIKGLLVPYVLVLRILLYTTVYTVESLSAFA